mmetsp:Transcript_4420/g.14649  ORF Transcript_4420/g.14649 Transcript_4420/m.14649 type:complete len:351 (-) Transcript_4420:2864-3916(-)
MSQLRGCSQKEWKSAFKVSMARPLFSSKEFSGLLPSRSAGVVTIIDGRSVGVNPGDTRTSTAINLQLFILLPISFVKRTLQHLRRTTQRRIKGPRGPTDTIERTCSFGRLCHQRGCAFPDQFFFLPFFWQHALRTHDEAAAVASVGGLGGGPGVAVRQRLHDGEQRGLRRPRTGGCRRRKRLRGSVPLRLGLPRLRDLLLPRRLRRRLPDLPTRRLRLVLRSISALRRQRRTVPSERLEEDAKDPRRRRRHLLDPLRHRHRGRVRPRLLLLLQAAASQPAPRADLPRRTRPRRSRPSSFSSFSTLAPAARAGRPALYVGPHRRATAAGRRPSSQGRRRRRIQGGRRASSC